jgi:hypothetical protein
VKHEKLHRRNDSKKESSAGRYIKDNEVILEQSSVLEDSFFGIDGTTLEQRIENESGSSFPKPNNRKQTKTKKPPV